jgi:hypothetical protein
MWMTKQQTVGHMIYSIFEMHSYYFGLIYILFQGKIVASMDQGLTITWSTNLIHHQRKTYVTFLRVCFLSDI